VGRCCAYCVLRNSFDLHPTVELRISVLSEKSGKRTKSGAIASRSSLALADRPDSPLVRFFRACLRYFRAFSGFLLVTTLYSLFSN
jgi:hypothetical protein